jgi:hypothetical protein
LPLLPRQVLLISLLTDLPLVAISTDAVSSSELEQPSRYNARALLSLSLVLGTLTALVELTFFATLRGQAASVSQTSLYLFRLRRNQGGRIGPNFVRRGCDAPVPVVSSFLPTPLQTCQRSA